MALDTEEVVVKTLIVLLACAGICAFMFFCGYQSGKWEGRETMRLEAVSHGYGELTPAKPGTRPVWQWIELGGGDD